MKTTFQMLPQNSLRVAVGCVLSLLFLLQASSVAGTPTVAASNPLTSLQSLQNPAPAPAPDPTRVAETLRSSPVMFIENVGQFDERARFQVRGGMGTMWLAEDAIWITVLERVSMKRSTLLRPDMRHADLEREDESRRGVNLKLSFPGANPHPRIEPFNRLETKVSYFIGNDPNQWHPDVPVWAGVRYVGLYPDVDLEVTSQNDRWTWRLACKANCQFALQNVRLRVEGADALALDGTHLRLTTTVGDFALPLLSIEGLTTERLDAQRAKVERINAQILDVTPPVSPSSPLPLVPSPSLQDNPDGLLYSTFLGGSGDDRGFATAVDGMGSAYVTGLTRSPDFPTTAGAFDTSYNGNYLDAFVVKVNADGTELVYATFLGGSEFDYGLAIAVDGAGSAYVTGVTQSSGFPTTVGAFDTSFNGLYDTFVVKVNANGTGLAYATFLGGSNDDSGKAIALGGMDSVYVAGETFSLDFPTTVGAFDTSYNGAGSYSGDAFVVKVNASGTGLAYATFLGGSSGDECLAIAVDGAGSAYVTGGTQSSGFPTTVGAFDTSFNGLYDTFVVKVNASGTGLAYATFLGGSSTDYGKDIAVDAAGNAYVTGGTQSSDFPTTAGAFDTNPNGFYDAFVVKVNASGTGLAYATFLGGSNNDVSGLII